MEITVRQMGLADRLIWAVMRAALWPGETQPEEVDEFLASKTAWGFIAETSEGKPVGFAELALRNYANGCTTRPVPFLEGIWVRAEFRRRGIGARLIGKAEAFLAERGFREIGSDALVENQVSHAAHAGWGFTETERVVYFRKPLRPMPSAS